MKAMTSIKNNIVVLDEDDVYKNGYLRNGFYDNYAKNFTGMLEITRKQDNPFDLSSNIVQKRSYKSGLLHGDLEDFKRGKLIKRFRYKDGKKHGVSKQLKKPRFFFTWLPYSYEIFINGKNILSFIPLKIRHRIGMFYLTTELLLLLLTVLVLQGLLWICYYVSEDLYNPLSRWTKRHGLHC